VCPFEAVESGYCENCPQKQAQDCFQETTVECLNKNPRTKDKWQKWGFDNLVKNLLDIINAEEIPKNKWTVKTGVLFGVWQTAKRRAERIENFRKPV